MPELHLHVHTVCPLPFRELSLFQEGTFWDTLQPYDNSYRLQPIEDETQLFRVLVTIEQTFKLKIRSSLKKSKQQLTID